MLLDVVLSRQRRYQERVLPLVARWEADSEAHSLRWLAAHELDQKRYGLRSGESATIAALAGNLVSFVDGRGLGEDDACMRWAQAVAGGVSAITQFPTSEGLTIRDIPTAIT